MKIGIVGCGIGGLAAAGFLGAQGHAVTLYDQFDTPSSVGSGLVVQPVGQAVLALLGVLEYATTRGAPIFQMKGIEADSRKPVLQVGYSQTRFGLGMHRAALFEAVKQAALRAGARIAANSFVNATFLENGKRHLRLAGEQIVGPFDLVIDASGAGSVLSPLKARALPYGAYWGVVETPPNSALPGDHLSQCYRKASAMAGVLPIGFMPEGGGHKTAVFWSAPTRDFANWGKHPIERWRKEAVALWPEFAPYACQINDHKDLTPAQYSHGNLHKPVAERLVFIGDAAHRASPQLGQGANMALLDALVLSAALGRMDLQPALLHYAKARRWHVRIYQMLSRVFTPMYQSDSTILPLLRDRLLFPATQIPPVPWLLRKLVSGEMLPCGYTFSNARNSERQADTSARL